MLPLNYEEDKRIWGRQALNYFETIMLGRRYTTLTCLDLTVLDVYIFGVYIIIYLHNLFSIDNNQLKHFCPVDKH